MQALYMNDCYLKEFEAVVRKSDGKYIILDQTAFYPNSGGQPHDEGVMIKNGEEYKVVYAIKKDGQISHEVDKEGLFVGDVVNGIIDWQRRYMLMRMHTAAHILSTIFHKEAGALITGNQLGITQSRIDFSLETFDKEKINEFISKANEIIREEHEIKIYFLKRDEAMKIPDVVKLAAALPPNIEELRIVEISSVDIQADGGTHIKNTKEIGEIELVKTENKGKNNRRVYYTVK